MSDIVFRKGEHVILRPFNRIDVPTLCRWMNDPEVTKYLMRPLPITENEEGEWVNDLPKRKNDVVLGIVETVSSKLIGSIGLHGINWQHRTATTGTVLGEKEYWGKGLGTEAKMLLLDFAFNTFDLHCVLSKILATNGRSIAYGKKCGYEEVGRIPNWIRQQNGERCDQVHLLVTQERWRPLWLRYLSEKSLSKVK
jgi:ribosomal-protein-alanine N-acetyltransferase